MNVRFTPPGGATPLEPALLARLEAAVGPDHVLVAGDAVDDAGRDWWPLTQMWERQGDRPALPAAVVRPGSSQEVASVLAAANEARTAVTAFGGRSGACGASLPVRGGISLDVTRLDAVLDVDRDNLLCRTQAGVFGPDYEAALNEAGLTGGHFPQSMDMSTVGGWIACRGAGQYSNRYGKIEDIVRGVEVVLADGRVLRTNPAPAAATGPDLMRLFVGAEGTLGVITEATMQVWPRPPAVEKRAWTLGRFADGLEILRRTLRAGARPACLRLYDGPESARNFELPDDRNLLVLLAEGDADEVAWQTKVVHDAVADTFDARIEDAALVDRWLEHRNNVSVLNEVLDKGIVVDTIEIAAPWSSLPGIYTEVQSGVLGVDRALACTAHSSHAYPSGGCLYFTFAGVPDPDRDSVDAFYDACWDAAMGAVLAAGGTISHHHGIGLVRARFMRRELGDTGIEVLTAVKAALDPNGILNPDKLGLGSIVWDGRH